MTDRPPDPASSAAGLLAALDAAAVQRLRELDPDNKHGLLARVFDTFADSLVKHVGELEQARAGNDREAMRQIAHTLKSSSASVGALELSRACAEVERLVREGHTGSLDAPLDTIVAQMRHLLALAGRAAPGRA